VQGAVRQIAHGDEISKIKIRDDDMWQEWMQEFNVMIDRIQPLNLQYRPVNDLSSDVASGQEVT
jgi:hypothetical protein